MLRVIEPNVPEEFVFPHIAAFFGTLTSVWLWQRSTTLHEKTSPSGAKQFLKSKFLSRQGEKLSNADALRGVLTQYRRKFAFKNRIGFDSPQFKIYSSDCNNMKDKKKQPQRTANFYPCIAADIILFLFSF